MLAGRHRPLSTLAISRCRLPMQSTSSARSVRGTFAARCNRSAVRISACACRAVAARRFAQHLGLICRKAARRDSGDGYDMSKGPAQPAAGGFNSFLCPNCAKPMTHVRTIWRAFQDNLEVLECRRCNISVSQTVKPKANE